MQPALATRVGLHPICAQMRKLSKQYWKRFLKLDTQRAGIAYWHLILLQVSFTTASRTYSRKAISESSPAPIWSAIGKVGPSNTRSLQSKMAWPRVIGRAGRL